MTPDGFTTLTHVQISPLFYQERPLYNLFPTKIKPLEPFISFLMSFYEKFWHVFHVSDLER